MSENFSGILTGDEDTYSHGACHIHAVAAQRAHGGTFMVFLDEDDVYWEYADGDCLYSVLHVMSLHQTPGGEIVRDIFGDRAAEDALQHIIDTFGRIGILIEYEHSEADLLSHYVDDGSGEKPLRPYDGADISAAAELATVKALPAEISAWPASTL